MLKNSLKIVLLVAITVLSTQSYAQLTVTGSETKVNTTTANSQIHPETAMDTTGNYVVVWASYGEDGDDYGIYGQLYDAGGTPNGTQITISNTSIPNGQTYPDVSMADNGDFVVVWMSDQEDSDDQGIYARRYNADGTAKAVDFRVNSGSADNQTMPQVAVAGTSGNMVFVWVDEIDDGSEQGVYARLYLSNGAATSSPYLVNTSTTGYQGHPSIAMNTDGDHVIAWQGVDASAIGVFAQVYDNSTVPSPVGSEIAINSTTAENQQEPSVGINADGSFMVAWSSYAQDGDGFGIYGRMYNNAGTATSSEILLNTTTAGTQDNSAISISTDGKYIVAWTSFNQDGDHAGIYAQIVSSDGSLDGNEENINTRSTDYQQLPTVGGSSISEDVIIVWQDGLRSSTSTHDGSDYGVYSQLYSSADVTDPVAVCQDITVYLDGTGNITIAAADVDGGSTDNVGVDSLYINTSAFTCSDIGVVNVSLTVFDAAGNSDGCVAVVTIADTTSPTVVCQNINAYLDATGNITITAADVDNGSTDNCGTPTMSIDVSTFTCADGVSNVTLTATDAYANTSSCVAVVTVLDTISPTVVCQNINAYLDATGNVTIAAADVDGGSSDNCGAPAMTIDVSSFTCANVGANNVTLTATDAVFNASSCVAVVTVIDTISPTVVCQNINAYLDATGNVTIVAADVDGGSTASCGTPTMSIDVASFTCSDVGANNVTLTATGSNSNTSSCVAIVTVLDTISPTVACQNVTVYLDGTGSASITAADVDNGSTDNCGTPTMSIDLSSFTCSDVGANNVTLTATDANSNVSTCVAVVTVVDTTSPTVVCQNINAYLDGTGNVTIVAADVDGGSSDNCGAPTMSIDVSSFTCAEIGANNVTLTATDASSNTSTCVAVVTVIDTVSPTVVCQNITVYLDGTGNASIVAADVDGGSSASCGTPTMSIDVSSFTCAEIGANNVTLTATDASSNVSTCVAIVTVVDTTSATVACQNITVYLDGTGNATITAADVDNGSTDNCGTPTMSIDVSSFTCAEIGANNVTLTATDASSNVSTCVAIVTVMDTITPTAVCQNINVYLDGTGNASILVADVDGGSSVSCGAATLSIDVSSFTCSEVGANNVTLTVTDASLNTSNCVAVVTVIDTISPTVVCQNLTVYLDGTGNATITAADVDGGSTSSCGTPTMSIDVSSFTCANVGANNVTLTATDVNSNISSCVAVVTVVDTIAPTVVCQNINAYLDATGNVTIVAADVDGGSTTSCGTPAMSIDVSSFTCAEIGANNVTLTVTDENSNTSTCVAVVTVMDTISPVVTCPGNQIENFNASCQFTLPDYTSLVSAADNCNGSPSIVQSPIAGSVISGNTTITMTSDDGNGNTSTCTFDIIPNDATAPVAICQNITVYLDGTGNATITGADVDGGSIDNCGTPILSVDVSSFTCANLGANNVTLTASDGININTCVALVTVLDTVSPVITCPSDVVVCENVVTGIAPVVNDNCSATTVTYTLSGVTSGSGSNDASGLTFNTGLTTVEYTAVDGTGNSTTCSFNVTTGIVDTSLTVSAGGDTLTANAGSASYKWIDCSTGNYVPSETNQSFGVTVSGTYALEITQGSCVDTSSCYNVVITGIDDISLIGINVYPNPTRGIVDVELSSVFKEVELIVLDLLGQEIIHEVFENTSHLRTDLNYFADGIYFVKVIAADKEVVVKIIKE